MTRERSRFRLFLIVLFASILQVAIGGQWHASKWSPDIAVTCLLLVTLYAKTSIASQLGLLTGLIEASYSGRAVGSLCISRTLVATCVGYAEEHIVRDQWWFALGVVFIGSMTMETLFYVMAPGPSAIRWFSGSLTQSTANVVVAIPGYFIVKRLTKPKEY